MSSFTGFGPGALRFLEQLEANNERAWFQKNKQVYEDVLKQPMEALVADLEGEFGEGKVFRIYRDVRFSADKSPYKTHVAATVGRNYVSLSPDAGLYVGGGAYMLSGDALKRYRAAVDDATTGPKLERVLAALTKKGAEIAAHETLRTAPKGYSRDHPRLELLQHKGITAGRRLGDGAWLSTRKAYDKVRAAMAELRPLMSWIDDAIG